MSHLKPHVTLNLFNLTKPTIRHQGNNGMRCPAVVGGSTFVGYNSEQCYWTIGAKPKRSTQAQDPHLNVETRERSSFWTNRTKLLQPLKAQLYLGAVGTDGDSEQVHGHKHPSHHADQNGVTGVPV